MDIQTLLSYFGIGVLVGFGFYVVFSLLGYAIYKILNIIEKGG